MTMYYDKGVKTAIFELIDMSSHQIITISKTLMAENAHYESFYPENYQILKYNMFNHWTEFGDNRI